MKHLNDYIIEKFKVNSNNISSSDINETPIKSIESKNDLEKYLNNNNINFKIDKKGRYDNSTDYIIDTQYEGVKVIYGFIGSIEYLASVEKDDKEIMYFDSSKELSYRNEFTVKFLDPIAYFNDCLKTCKKKLQSANKGKRNNRTGEYQKNYSDIAFYEKKIKKYEKWISEIK